jgi:excisionase family DNA binding protein
VTVAAEPPSTPDDAPSALASDLDALVGEWLTLPEVASMLGVSVGGVRRLIEEGELLAFRRGERSVLSVPAKFVTAEGPLTHLRGTLTVLSDGRVEPREALQWLFTPDPTLSTPPRQPRPPEGIAPIDALVMGQRTEIRRRAAELAL